MFGKFYRNRAILCDFISKRVNNRNQGYYFPFSLACASFFPIPFSLSHKRLPSQRFSFYIWYLSYVAIDDDPAFSVLRDLYHRQSCVAANYSSAINNALKLHDYSVRFTNASTY
jgi:hypothetical protein